MESGFSELMVEEKDLKIRIEKKGVALQSPLPIVKIEETKAVLPNSEEKYIKAPMVGAFYRASSPADPPFVETGDIVEKGKIVCIIEAMKLFNEIESEKDCKIIKILAENGKPVEYGQPLFAIEEL